MKLFVKAKQLPKLSMLAILIVLLFSACDPTPQPPSITQIKVCNEAMIDNVLCESNLNIFNVDEPKIYVSALFSDIDSDRLIRFTLFGLDSNGNWINILSTPSSPGAQGSFDEDETKFRMNVHFAKNTSSEWVKTTYKIEVEIDPTDDDDGAMEAIEFQVT